MTAALSLKGASVVTSVRGTVTVEVVMRTLIHLSFPFSYQNSLQNHFNHKSN